MAIKALGTESSFKENCYKPHFCKLLQFNRPRAHPKPDQGKKPPYILCNMKGNSHVTWFTKGKTADFIAAGEGSNPLVLLFFRAKLEYWP